MARVRLCPAYGPVVFDHAPSGPAAHKVQEGADACSINNKGLIIGQVDGVAVVVAQAVDVNGLVGGALVRDAAIVGVGLREAARHDGRAVELQIAQSAVRPAQNGLLVVSASVLGLHCGSIGLCGNVHQSLAGKHAVDGASLCVHNSCNGGILGEAGSHNQVGHDAARLDGAAFRRVVAGRRQLDGRVGRDLAQGLHGTLAEGLRADDGGALVILQGAGNDFRGGSGAGIDQYH